MLLASFVAIGASLGSALTTDQDITTNPATSSNQPVRLQVTHNPWVADSNPAHPF
jgi:hypothetical protein